MSTPVPNPQQFLNVPCTAVLVQLTMRAGVTPDRVMPHIVKEVQDTVQLYLDGKIQQWWAMCDRPGVSLLFAAPDVETVRDWMAELPLVKEDLAELVFTRLGPLMPLRVLGGMAPAA